MPVLTSAHGPTGGRHCRFAATTVPAACGCPVASRHSARGSGKEGANRKNVPLDRVPLAGSTPLKGRQADFYKYQSGRRRTTNSEASPNQEPRRTALYSPAEVDARKGRPRERSPEPLVLARFWLLLPRGKSNRRVRGRGAPGGREETTPPPREARQRPPYPCVTSLIHFLP